MRIRRSRRGVRSRSHVRGRERNRWGDQFASSFSVPVLFDIVLQCVRYSCGWFCLHVSLASCLLAVVALANRFFLLRSFSLAFWPLLSIIVYLIPTTTIRIYSTIRILRDG